MHPCLDRERRHLRNKVPARQPLLHSMQRQEFPVAADPCRGSSVCPTVHAVALALRLQRKTTRLSLMWKRAPTATATTPDFTLTPDCKSYAVSPFGPLFTLCVIAEALLACFNFISMIPPACGMKSGRTVIGTGYSVFLRHACYNYNCFYMR